MFLIFGFKTKAYPLGWVAMACQVCGRAGSLFLVREATKFSLFFIPLFTVRSKHVVECQNPYCRSRTRISGDEAHRLLDAGVRAAH